MTHARLADRNIIEYVAAKIQHEFIPIYFIAIIIIVYNSIKLHILPILCIVVL